VIVDNSGQLAPAIVHGLDGKLADGQPQFTVEETVLRPAPPDALQQDLRARINSEKLDAYLWIPQDLDESFELHLRNPDNFALIGPLSRSVDQALISSRFEHRGVHLDDLQTILKGTDLKLLKVSEAGESVEKGRGIAIATAPGVLLCTSLLMYGIITLRSVIEEKATPTREVLISSVRPFELLAGKILGVAAVAFTPFAIWMTTTALLFPYGVPASWGLTRTSPLVGVHVPISLVIYAGVFFIGGYFMYASMFAAIGSACSNEQDAQQWQWLAMAPLVFCMIIYGVLLNDPASRNAVILSEIPSFAPVLMSLRISLQTPPAWQIALSLTLLILTTIGVMYASAKIYRIGVLMYGKRPALVELVRRLRYT
jgi:ABC-2 type transport system permease protein